MRFSIKLIHKILVKVGPALSDALRGCNDEMTSLLMPSLAGNYPLGREIERAEFNYQTSVFPLEMLIDLCLYSNHFYVNLSGNDCTIRTNLKFIQTQWWSLSSLTFRLEYQQCDPQDGTDQILKNDLTGICRINNQQSQLVMVMFVSDCGSCRGQQLSSLISGSTEGDVS